MPKSIWFKRGDQDACWERQTTPGFCTAKTPPPAGPSVPASGRCETKPGMGVVAGECQPWPVLVRWGFAFPARVGGCGMKSIPETPLASVRGRAKAARPPTRSSWFYPIPAGALVSVGVKKSQGARRRAPSFIDRHQAERSLLHRCSVAVQCRQCMQCRPTCLAATMQRCNKAMAATRRPPLLHSLSPLGEE